MIINGLGLLMYGMEMICMNGLCGRGPYDSNLLKCRS